MPYRRSVVLAGLSWGLCFLPLQLMGKTERTARHSGPGLITPPLPVPRVVLVLEDGQRTDLETLTRGRVTALQFVLTGCSSICPLLGAIFSRVQAALGDVADFQLISLSLDPANDTSDAFALWLQSFDAGRSWHGAIPQEDQEAIPHLLQQWDLSNGTSSQVHSETILLIDRQSRLVFRFPDLADPGFVADMMNMISRSSN